MKTFDKVEPTFYARQHYML